MNDVIETLERDGIKVVIHHDPYGETADPRDADNFCKLIFFGEARQMGDEHEYRSEDYEGWAALEAAIVADHPRGIVKPVYLMSHTGVEISTSDFMFRSFDPQGWDWQQVGFAVVSAEEIRANYCCQRITKAMREQAESLVDAEVDEYSHYINGEVYGYCVLDADGKDTDECEWGFIGMDAVRGEAEAALRGALESEREIARKMAVLEAE